MIQQNAEYYINWNSQNIAQSTFGVNGDSINPAKPIIFDSKGLVYSSESRDTIIGYHPQLDNENRNSTIIIPSSVKQITGHYRNSYWSGAFQYSTFIKVDFEANNLINIGEYSFANCRQIEEFNFPSSLRNINYSAFTFSFDNQNSNIQLDLSKCTKLIEIGSNAFSNTGFTKITLPRNLLDVGPQCFSNSKAMQFVFQSNLMSDIEFGQNCFEGIIPSATILFQDQEIFNYLKSNVDYMKYIFGTSYTNNLPNLKLVVNEEFITQIPDNPSAYDVFRIDENKIVGFTMFGSTLSDLVIPSNIESIENNFLAPVNFKAQSIDFSLATNLTTIGNNAFANFTSLKNLDLSNCAKLNSIGEKAFYNNKTLSNVVFPSGSTITSLGISAFEECVNLIRLENLFLSIRYIQNRTFYNCKLLQVDFNWFTPQLSKIGEFAFYSNNKIVNADLSKFTLLDEIGISAFDSCIGMKTITFDKNCKITEIKDSTFANCSSLTVIDLPNYVTTIGSKAFSACGSLTTVTIPENCFNFKAGAFELSNNISTINFNWLDVNNLQVQRYPLFGDLIKEQIIVNVKTENMANIMNGSISYLNIRYKLFTSNTLNKLSVNVKA